MNTVTDQLIIPNPIEEKILQKHKVSSKEVYECIANIEQKKHMLFEDTRQKNLTVPPTLWFISETDYGRKLKIVIVPTDKGIFLKTAYPPSTKEVNLYRKLSSDG